MPGERRQEKIDIMTCTLTRFYEANYFDWFECGQFKAK